MPASSPRGMTDPTGLAPAAARSRVLLLTTSYPRFAGDSAGHFVQAEAQALVRSGHQVTVLCAGKGVSDENSSIVGSSMLQVKFLGGSSLFDHPGAWPRLRQSPLRVTGLLTASLGVLRCAFSGAKGRDARGFDRIIAHWLIPCAYPWGGWLGRSDSPLEAVAHGSDVELLLRLPRPFRWAILRSLKKRRTRLRFVSNKMKRDLLRSSPPLDLEIYLRKANVQPAALDLELTPSRSMARAQLGLEPHDLWAVFVGRLIGEKRPRTALVAASLIPGLRIVVLGEGPLRNALQEEFPEVRFFGQTPRDTTLTWLAAADLCLATSLLEGAPTVVREARALGTPVVARNSGDCAEWGSHDPELWVVD